jgi:hypothetical protein
MLRLFTVQEATDLIPIVGRHVGDLQRAAADMAALRRSLAGTHPATVEARNGVQEIQFLLGIVHDAKAELDRLGVQLTDLESGVVDFPSRIGAEVVHLTWEQGQDAITHYHRLGGDTRQQPLPGNLPPSGHDPTVGA